MRDERLHEAKSVWDRLRIFFQNNVRYFPLTDLFQPQKWGLFMKVWPYTMVGYPRLANAYKLAWEAERQGVRGAFVECGVWKGGTAGILAHVAEKANSDRKIWLFDSFAGLPEPTVEDAQIGQSFAPGKSSGKLTSINECVASRRDVEKLFYSVLKISRSRVIIRKGWFQETLPKAAGQVGRIALLRIDADWYESTRCCLENLYDRVVRGGRIIIDDYGQFPGCRKAVDEFLAVRDVFIKVQKIDYTGVWFEKP